MPSVSTLAKLLLAVFAVSSLLTLLFVSLGLQGGHHEREPTPPETAVRQPPRRHLGRKIATGITVLTVLVTLYVLVYPALFASGVREPSIEVDPAEGKVWLDTKLVIELQGNFTHGEVLEALDIQPPVEIEPADVTVEQVADLPLHDAMPWAITRITINPEREALFRPETDYVVSISDQRVEFETITVPRVVSATIDRDLDGDRANVPTNTGVILQFNEEIAWKDEYLSVAPPVDMRAAALLDEQGRTVVKILPTTRFENSTNYTLTLQPGVRDVHDHPAGDPFSISFSTWPPPAIVAATPTGVTQPVDQPLVVQFERPVDAAAAQAAFSVTPAIPGTFEWEGDTIMRWRPAGLLPYSTEYAASIASIPSKTGDTYPAKQWNFRTQDPPFTLNIVGDLTGPTILEAKPSGGLGNFTYEWSGGQKDPRILVNVPHGETRTVGLRVTSGDQLHVQSVQVSGPPYPTTYVAADCPGGWGMVEIGICYKMEEGPGGNDIFMARIDPRDPELDTTAALSTDYLGAMRTVSEAATAHGALVATNADFFHQAPPGTTPVGPLISNGSIVRLDRRFDAAFVMSRDGRAWAAGPSASFLVLQGVGGEANVYNVNSVPGDGEIAIFNAHWAPTLSLPFDACFGTFAPTQPNLLAVLEYTCGPVSNIPLRNGQLVIVARGSATHWLSASAPAPIGVGDPFGLTTFDLMVGGSDALLQSGAPGALSGAHFAQAPRTVIGTDAGGFLYLIVVDGRRADSPGMTMGELQAHIKAFGLVEAVNLDGGGSSEMVLFQNEVRNKPSDGKERPVPGLIEVTRPRGSCSSALVRC